MTDAAILALGRGCRVIADALFLSSMFLLAVFPVTIGAIVLDGVLYFWLRFYRKEKNPGFTAIALLAAGYFFLTILLYAQ